MRFCTRVALVLVVLGWQTTTAQHGTFLGPLADSVTEALEDVNKAQVRVCAAGGALQLTAPHRGWSTSPMRSTTRCRPPTTAPNRHLVRRRVSWC